MTDDNVFHLTPKAASEDAVYNRIYGCLEAAFLNEKHNCPYCTQNNLVSQMLFEIVINELVSLSKKTKLQFSTFDAKMILNGVSERIVTLEQQTLVAKQEAGTSREGKLRRVERTDQESEETSSPTEETDRKATKDPISDGESKE